MTAIDKYIRLEAVGWWFEAGRQEAREVIVSFGDSTLQLSSLKDAPLTHWSLLATERIGTRGEAVIYSADPEQHEVLEIEDQDMIRAISAVTSALAPPPPPPKLRWFWRAMAVAGVASGLYYTPPLITKTATMLTPPARATALSGQLEAQLESDFGAPCQGWQGMRALEAFSASLFPDRHIEILVFENQPVPVLALPGDTISLSRTVIEQAGTPEILAVALVTAWATSENQRPLMAYIDSLGPLGALRYLITGTFPEPKAAPAPLSPSAGDFITARDYLRSQNLSTVALQKLAEKDGIGLPVSQSQTTATPFTHDSFESLQNICAE